MSSNDEKFLTIKEAAFAIGVPPWKLRKAANDGLFPIYYLGNKRKLVRLSEVIAAIENAASTKRHLQARHLINVLTA